MSIYNLSRVILGNVYQNSKQMNRFFSINLSTRFNFKTSDLKYTDKHEWVHFNLNDNIGTIGITDYAQDKLGEVVYAELPEINVNLDQSGNSLKILFIFSRFYLECFFQ
jgi:hypothetical protein